MEILTTHLYLKAFHLVFAVSWFAGLFYIIRLFIYHVEAQNKEEAVRTAFFEQYRLMQWRLWYIITWPALLLTVLFGTSMFINRPDLLQFDWIWAKIALVIGLIAYHLWCHFIFKRHQKDSFPYTSSKLRLINEVATLFLFAIVFVVVLKSVLDWIPALLGFMALAILLMIGIKAYKKYRRS